MGVNPNIGSDFVDYEPCGFMYHWIQKKRLHRSLFLGAQWDSFANAQATLSITNPVGSCTTRTQKKEVERLPFLGAQWDSNPRHSEPQSDALTN